MDGLGVVNIFSIVFSPWLATGILRFQVANKKNRSPSPTLLGRGRDVSSVGTASSTRLDVGETVDELRNAGVADGCSSSGRSASRARAMKKHTWCQERRVAGNWTTSILLVLFLS